MVRYATLSSMDLPLEVRFLIIMIARFADVHGVASVANSTLGEICRTGSHHTVERWISLAADVGILRKSLFTISSGLAPRRREPPFAGWY